MQQKSVELILKFSKYSTVDTESLPLSTEFLIIEKYFSTGAYIPGEDSKLNHFRNCNMK